MTLEPNAQWTSSVRPARPSRAFEHVYAIHDLDLGALACLESIRCPISRVGWGSTFAIFIV